MASAFRAVLLALLLFGGFLGSAPPTLSHEGQIHHLEVRQNTLAPGANETLVVDFERGPLIQGWFFFVLVNLSEGDSLLLTLEKDHLVVHQWTITSLGRSLRSALLSTGGPFSMRLANPSATKNASYHLYFDQSCNCPGKIVPVQLDRPLLVFNIDAEAEERIDARFLEPDAVNLKVSVATLKKATAQWPEDFEILASSSNPHDALVSGETRRAHLLYVAANQTGRYYFFVEGTGYDPSRHQTAADIGLSPEILLHPPVPSWNPWPWIGGAAVLLILGGALTWWIRRKRSP